MKVHIYKPSKSTMQSARGRTGEWVLEGVSTTAKIIESLMGWTSVSDTYAQIHLKFPTLDAAQTYAENHGYEYSVAPAQERKVEPRNYADNFRYSPPQE